MTRKPHDPNAAPTLSPQQKTALWLFACGNPITDVAKLMFIAGPTAKEHLHRAYRALGARNGVHAVHLAYQLGFFQVMPTTFERDLEPDTEPAPSANTMASVMAIVDAPYRPGLNVRLEGDE